MFLCKKGHEFSETDARGKIENHGVPFLVCPFCGDLVPVSMNNRFKYISYALRAHEEKLDQIGNKLENLFIKLKLKK
jgi:hypothetical protein